MSEGDISQFEYDNFFDACQAFHKEAFLYAVKWFLLNYDLLKEAAFLNILDQKSCFQDILNISKKLEKYIKFTSNELVEMEQEFLLLQSITLDDFDSYVKEELCIRVDDEGEGVTYRIDVLLYHLYEMKIPGASKSKFENLFKLAMVVLCIVHSNAEEESLFSRVKKNFTPQKASLTLDGSLSSIMSFQLNRGKNEPCYKYNPSQNVLKRSKEVTWEYNKGHSKKHKEKVKSSK